MPSARYEALGQTQKEIDNTLDIARGTKKVVKVAAKVAKAGVFGEEAQAAGHAAGKIIGAAGTAATIGEAVSDFHQAAHLEGAARDQANAHMISHAGSNAGATGGGVLAGIATGALLGSETGAVFGPVGSLTVGLVGGAAGGFMGSEAGKWAAAKFLDSTAGHDTVKAIGNLQSDIRMQMQQTKGQETGICSARCKPGMRPSRDRKGWHQALPAKQPMPVPHISIISILLPSQIMRGRPL